MAYVNIDDFEITICGRMICLKRSLETARKLEAVVGPLVPFAEALERGQVTATLLVRFYEALLKGETEAPSREQLEKWVIRERGLYGHRETAFFVMSLTVGTKNLEAYLAKRAQEGGQKAHET